MVDRVRPRRGGLAVAAALVLVAGSGCLSAPQIRHTSGPEAAFIYGFFDVSGKKGTEIGCVGVVQDERVGGTLRQGCMAGQPDGLFWAADVPPIRHHLHGFHVEDTYNSLVKFREPFPLNEGELHFYGIYRYDVISNPIIGKGTFALVPTNRPTHAEVLRKLLARDEISDRWKQRIRAKLKELGDKS